MLDDFAYILRIPKYYLRTVQEYYLGGGFISWSFCIKLVLVVQKMDLTPKRPWKCSCVGILGGPKPFGCEKTQTFLSKGWSNFENFLDISLEQNIAEWHRILQEFV